jgi:L-malate glycosyltransferase
MLNVVHLTAHLGGGVGRALAGIAANADDSEAHSFVCLEKPEKNQFVDLIAQAGCEVLLAPDQQTLLAKLGNADIVQVEWWNHPALLGCLAGLPELPMRLVIWCHVSGLSTPIIPALLLGLPHRFIFTSASSLQAETVLAQPIAIKSKLAVISSCGGFTELPEPAPESDLASRSLSVGYMGSLNFAKLHPDYVSFLAAVPLPDFTVELIGDTTNQTQLQAQCEQLGNPGLLRFQGYTSDVVTALSSINVLAYLLNPYHYGTTENALLEAMAMGIVPVVMNNPVERCIVDDKVTGLLVSSCAEFTDAIVWLSEHPYRRAELGCAAASHVRRHYSPQRSQSSFAAVYRDVAGCDKRSINFQSVLGSMPSDWFLSCQQNRGAFSDDGQVNLAGDDSDFGLFESSKGSVRHFHRSFPDDPRLAAWAFHLESIL